MEPRLGQDAERREGHGGQVEAGAPARLLELGQPPRVAGLEAAEAVVLLEGRLGDARGLAQVAQLLPLVVGGSCVWGG